MKLLIVEDDPTATSDIRQLLTPHCDLVNSASNMKDALGLIRTQSFDLLITEVVIEDIEGKYNPVGGLYVAVAFHFLAKGEPANVIIISGDTPHTEIMHRLQGYGVSHCFTKPLDHDDLLDRVLELRKESMIRSDERRQLHHIKQIEKRAQEFNTYLGSVTHDLKSPFNRIHLLAQGAIEAIEPIKTDMLKTRLNRIIEIAEKGTEYVHTILDFVKFSKDDIDFSMVNLDTLLVQLMETNRLELQQHNILVTNDGNLGIVFANESLVARIFDNLMSNCIKYRDPKRSQSTIHFGRSSKKNDVVVFVKDNGLGMDEEIKIVAFEAFVRSKDQDSDSHGLGLSFCKAAMKKMHGDIELDSKVGEGTCVTLIFPRV